LDLIIIDYVQLMRTSQQLGSRMLEIAAIGRALRALAKELELPILVISRLAGVAAHQALQPVLADLREECGSLEYEADLVWLCHLVGLELEVIQARWRDGPEGAVKLRCDPARQDFSDIEN
jgi:replicative DNA helicase